MGLAIAGLIISGIGILFLLLAIIGSLVQ